MLMTRAPRSAAQVVPLASALQVAQPSVPATRIGMIFESAATADTPAPLLVIAAAVPAALVPWP